LKLWDKDRWTTDDFLGEVTVDISKFNDKQTYDAWLALDNEPKKKGPERGEVHLSITYESGRPAVNAPVPAQPQQQPQPQQQTQPQQQPHTTTTNGGGGNSQSAPPTQPSSAAADQSASAGLHTPHPHEKLEDKYEIGKEVGRGGFSVVKRGRNRQTNEDVAIKCINKKTLKKDELQLLSREINIMKKLQHRNIVQLHDIFETQTDLYLVLEFVPGGELFDQIVERGSYSEHDAALLVKQILEGIDYMHKHGVVHRDLKPENLLCANPKNDPSKASVIKIADFGLSKDVETGNLQTSCGTPSYVAPEVLMGGSYDNEVDIWSIGVITFVLLCGFTPFYGDNQRQLFERILHAQFDFPSPEWDEISAAAKDFVKKLLVVNPAQRLTAGQALTHEWIHKAAPKRELRSFGSVRDGIRNLKAAPPGRKEGDE